MSGSTIVVGAYYDDDAGSKSGSAYVFEKSDDGEWAQAAKLVAADAAVGDHFGYSGSVSGSTIVVGAYGDDDAGSCSGSAYVFESNRVFTSSDDSDDDDSEAAGDWTFMSENSVPQGGCDFELCGLHEYNVGIFSFVDNCLGGGAGCVGLTSGCRHCTINPGQVGTPAEWLPACPKCICEEHELDPSLCSSEPSPVAETDVETVAPSPTSGAFLGAQLGAAAAAAAAGVAMHRSRRASRASDEDPLLFKGAKYGAASV